MLHLLSRLSAIDRLRLLAFDCELRWVPRPLVSVFWEALDALENRNMMAGSWAQPGRERPRSNQ
jgi:hypothetical protein